MLLTGVDIPYSLGQARQGLAQAEAALAQAEVACQNSAALSAVGRFAVSYLELTERLDKATWELRRHRHVVAGLERLAEQEKAHLAEQARREAQAAADAEAKAREAAEAKARAEQEAAEEIRTRPERDAKADRLFLETMCEGLTPEQAEARLAKHQANRQARRDRAAQAPTKPPELNVAGRPVGV